MKITQENRILEHLQQCGSITSWEAIKEFGATRLSAIIFNLKEKGYLFNEEWVTATNRYGDSVSFKKYILL